MMGTMGPDEVKEFVTEAVQTLDQVTDTLTAVATEVPATEEPGLTEESPPEQTPSIDNAEPSPPPMMDSATNDTEEPPVVKTAEGDDPEKDEMKSQIASLNTKIASMIRDGEVKDLATKYASLWPIKQQASKFASFSKSKESVQILTARLKEAESLMSHTKVATSKTDFNSPTISTGIYSGVGSQKSASMETNHVSKAQVFVNV